MIYKIMFFACMIATGVELSGCGGGGGGGGVKDASCNPGYKVAIMDDGASPGIVHLADYEACVDNIYSAIAAPICSAGTGVYLGAATSACDLDGACVHGSKMLSAARSLDSCAEITIVQISSVEPFGNAGVRLSGVLSALEWAETQDFDSISFSLGAPGMDWVCNAPWVHELIRDVSIGTSIYASYEDNDRNLMYPWACSDETVTITDRNDTKADWAVDAKDVSHAVVSAMMLEL